MPSLTAKHWKILEAIFIKDGFTLERKSSSHNVYVKVGCARPVIIPRYDAVGIDIIKNNMKTANMTRERYFQLLAKCGG
jgi:predicted RNA binding protein YcfA (HicA-like mRNA interferase family)